MGERCRRALYPLPAWEGRPPSQPVLSRLTAKLSCAPLHPAWPTAVPAEQPHFEVFYDARAEQQDEDEWGPWATTCTVIATLAVSFACLPQLLRH